MDSNNKIELKYKKTSNVFLTSINLCNMIIGSVLANAMSQSGVLLGVFLLLISSVFADFSIMAIAKSGTLLNKFTYQSVILKALGNFGLFIITICQILYPLFDSTINNNLWYLNEKFFLFIATFFIIFPLSSFGNIAMLDKVSFCSIILVFVYIIIVIYNTPYLLQNMFYQPGFFSYGRLGFINSISVFAFALSCHHNVLPIFRSMNQININKFSIATHASLLITTIIYIIIALVGYISFTGNASGNLLKDYCSNNISIMIARGAFTITVLLTAPLQIYSSREAILTIICKKLQFNQIVHFIVTFLLVSMCYLIAIFILEIELIMSFSGSLIAAVVVYILPGLSLLIIMNQGFKINTYTKLACYSITIFGSMILIIGTCMSIVNFTKPQSTKIKYWCNEAIFQFNNNQLKQIDSLTLRVIELWKSP